MPGMLRGSVIAARFQQANECSLAGTWAAGDDVPVVCAFRHDSAIVVWLPVKPKNKKPRRDMPARAAFPTGKNNQLRFHRRKASCFRIRRVFETQETDDLGYGQLITVRENP
jgi:hypothetical protein